MSPLPRLLLATLLLLPAALLPAAIIGSDDRYPQSDSGQFPFRAIGLLEGDDATCTATLIGPQHILTAAHCLLDVRQPGQWRRNLYFTAARNGLGEQPYASQRVVRGWVDSRYIDAMATLHRQQQLNLNSSQSAAKEAFIKQTLALDYAVAELDQEIGRETGWLGLQTLDSTQPPLLQFSGYPVDKGRYSPWFTLCQSQPQAEGPWLQRCDLSEGMSGAGALLRSYEGGFSLGGLYAAGSPAHNYLIPFDATLRQRLFDWRADLSDNQTSKAKLSHDPGRPLQLLNQCSHEVQAVVHYRDADNRWITSSWQTVPGEQQQTLARINGDSFYFYAESRSKPALNWGGRDMLRQVGGSGRQYGFSQVQLPDARPVPYQHRIQCR